MMSAGCAICTLLVCMSASCCVQSALLVLCSICCCRLVCFSACALLADGLFTGGVWVVSCALVYLCTSCYALLLVAAVLVVLC